MAYIIQLHIAELVHFSSAFLFKLRLQLVLPTFMAALIIWTHLGHQLFYFTSNFVKIHSITSCILLDPFSVASHTHILPHSPVQPIYTPPCAVLSHKHLKEKKEINLVPHMKLLIIALKLHNCLVHYYFDSIQTIINSELRGCGTSLIPGCLHPDHLWRGEGD